MTFPQAHVGDPITHADTSGANWGAIGGGAVGAIVVVFTAPASLSLGAIVGGISLIAGAASVGSSAGQMVVDPTTTKSVDGHIGDGSPDTFIGVGRQKAARASGADPKTTVDCHAGEYVITGSLSVTINRWHASRRDDVTSEGGKIADGDRTVFTGERSVPLFQVGELPLDANLLALHRMELALALAGMLALPETRLGWGSYVLGGVSTGAEIIEGPTANHPWLDRGSATLGAADLALGFLEEPGAQSGFAAVRSTAGGLLSFK